MPRFAENTIMVLLAFALTGMAVFAVVENIPVSTSAVVAAGQADDSLTCPATGCTAVSCHATSSSAATSTDGETLQTCPATGCTSYGCHATEGGSGGGHGRGGMNGRGSAITVPSN